MTGSSPAHNRAVTGPAGRRRKVRGMASDQPASWVVLVFMAGVTCAVLAMAFAEMAKGLAHAPATLAYALTAACGLEYLSSAWPRGARREL